MFILASFIIAKKIETSQCPPNDNGEIKCGISIQWNILFGNKNEVLIHVTIWMNFENIRLSERGRSQKTTY